MFGKSKKTKAIADAIANYANGTHTPELIHPEQIRVKQIPMLSPNESHEVYAFQWGDVTFLAWYRSDEDILIAEHYW